MFKPKSGMRFICYRMASLNLLLDYISCSLCKVQFDRNKHVPKLLPCQHTFCSDCLSSLRAHSLDVTLDETIQCQVCGRKITIPDDGFSTNWTVFDIAEEIQNTAANISICTKHDRQCVAVCIDCLVVLCVICLKKSSHPDHNLEEPSKAKALLHQRFSTPVKKRVSTLEENLQLAKDASCDGIQVLLLNHYFQRSHLIFNNSDVIKITYQQVFQNINFRNQFWYKTKYAQLNYHFRIMSKSILDLNYTM